MLGKRIGWGSKGPAYPIPSFIAEVVLQLASEASSTDKYQLEACALGGFIKAILFVFKSASLPLGELITFGVNSFDLLKRYESSSVPTTQTIDNLRAVQEAWDAIADERPELSFDLICTKLLVFRVGDERQGEASNMEMEPKENAGDLEENGQNGNS
ncbi:hypothetical protein BDV93DRAFT_612028 [Ceratobasidium sp. AG-I]|nr:hypothetical protein BDV93DRAFT_612028 [Ceratobasidium sp. AG-I]